MHHGERIRQRYGNGKPLASVLTPGQHHEMRVLEELLDAGQIKRHARWRPKLRPRYLLADRGYGGKKARKACRDRHITLVTPLKSHHRYKVPYDKELYKSRNRIERLVNRINRHRRIATRYEKHAASLAHFLPSHLCWSDSEPFAGTP